MYLWTEDWLTWNCTVGKSRNEQWDMNWLSYTIRGVKDCVKHPGISYWAWAVKDIGNNSLHTKHAKDTLRDSFSLSFQPCLYDFIITIMAMSKNQLWRGCTAQSTLQRQKKGEFLLHWSCSNSSKRGRQSAATWEVGTQLGEQNVFCAFSSFLSNDFFFFLTTSCDSNLNLCWEQVLGHTVPLKKQQIKPTRQPGSQASLSCRETLHGSISGSSLLPSFTQTPPRAQKILQLLPLDAVWRFPCAFRCQDHFGKLHTWANTWSSWLKI